MTVTLTANDTCAALFATHPEAVYSTATEEWMTVIIPGTGHPASYMIVRDRLRLGRYAISMSPEGLLGYVEPGTQPPGEIADILTDGIPLRRGSRS